MLPKFLGGRRDVAPTNKPPVQELTPVEVEPRNSVEIYDLDSKFVGVLCTSRTIDQAYIPKLAEELTRLQRLHANAKIAEEAYREAEKDALDIMEQLFPDRASQLDFVRQLLLQQKQIESVQVICENKCAIIFVKKGPELPTVLIFKSNVDENAMEPATGEPEVTNVVPMQPAAAAQPADPPQEKENPLPAAG